MYCNLQKIINNTDFARYCIVGLINTCLYLAVLWFLLKKILLSNGLATFIALLVSLFFQFSMNQKYTFKLKKTSLAVKMKYLLQAGVNYVLSNLCLIIFLNSFKMSVEISIALTTCFLVLSGFLMSKYWVFK